jgi:transposase-like protein
MPEDSPYDRDGETIDVFDSRLDADESDEFDGPKYQNEEWLFQQYSVLGKTQDEIADACDVRPNTIRRWIKRHEIDTRSGGPRPGPWKDEEWLRKQYVERQKSIRQIADEQDCDEKTIRNWLIEHGIETRNYSKRHPATREGRQYHDAEWLRRQYVELEQSTTEIAEECDTGRNVILNWLHRHGIETRDREEAVRLAYSKSVRVPDENDDSDSTDSSLTRSVGSRTYTGPETGLDVSYTSDMKTAGGETVDSPWRDEEWLREKYEEYGSTKPIADICGITPDAIRYWMDKFDIERERTGGRRESPEGVELYRDEEWLREKYDEHGTVVALVHEEPVDVTEGAIKYWMDRHGIERADAGVVGPEARREKGLMTYEDFLDALVDIHEQQGEWPTTTTYDDQRPSWAPSRSKAYQFSRFSGWGEAIEEAKENE